MGAGPGACGHQAEGIKQTQGQGALVTGPRMRGARQGRAVGLVRGAHRGLAGVMAMCQCQCALYKWHLHKEIKTNNTSKYITILYREQSDESMRYYSTG